MRWSTKTNKSPTNYQHFVGNQRFLLKSNILIDNIHTSSYYLFIIKKWVILLAKEHKKRITVSVTPEMDKKLRQEAKDRGLSVSTVVTLALEEYWKSGK